MKIFGNKILISILTIFITSVVTMAQNSAPAPGSGGGFNPAPAGGGPGFGGPGGPGFGGPGAPSWGGPWGPGYNSSPSIIINTPVIYPSSVNSGITKVIACGYDAQGIWRTIPLTVQYSYNGINYNVTVLNAWNPWTDMWNSGVDQPAYSTSYFLRGTTFDFYTNLSTGTYYFNL